MGRRSDARERLQASASELIHERGYNAVGVGEICAHAGVNKGSFYHFYPSKQQLGLDVIDRAWHDSRAFLEATLLGDGPPLARLRRYFEAVHAFHMEDRDTSGCLRGCPLGNLTLEMSTQDDLMRNRLSQTLDSHTSYFVSVLREAQNAGDLDAGLDIPQAADTILALIEGKVLLAKAKGNPNLLQDLPDVAGRYLGASL